MSEETVHSSKITLGSLSMKMQNRRNNYPLLAVTSEKLQYYYEKFIELLQGGPSPIRFEMALLNTCVEQYFDLIMIFVNDNMHEMPKNEILNVKQWLNILNYVGGIDIIPNKFTFFIPVLQNNQMEKLPLWCKKQFLIHFSQIFQKSTRLTFSEEELKSFLYTVSNWVKLLFVCGDYEFQTIIVETLLNACVMHHIKPIVQGCFPDKDVLKRMFVDVYQQKDYVNDLKTFLTTINNTFLGIRSVPFTRVTLQDTVILPLKGMKEQSSWMHINYGFRTLSFSCQRDSLRSIPGSDSDNNLQEYEFVTINFKDIGKIALLISNDTETMHSTGGIFAINLTGQCSCRFSSSKPIVLSIRKIGMILAPGDDLQFLKGEFVRLFGKRFKVAYKIPIKGRNVSDKKDSVLQPSTQNLSVQESIKMSTGGNNSTQNLRLEHSWTLGNKENVSEDINDYSPNTSRLLSTKSALNDRNENTNTQLQYINNEEDRIANKNLKIKTPSTTATTENDFPCLINLDIDTLPSNYKFGEDTNLTILKEDQSPILSFINTQLSTIPGLESPFLPKNKSEKIKSSQDKKANQSKNSSIVDVSTMNATTSGYKTRSKTQTGMDCRSKKNILNSRNDGLTQAESVSEKVLRKSRKLPEITSKHKKETTSHISYTPLKGLRRNYKKDAKNRRKSNKDDDTVKIAESEFYSINPDVNPIYDNSATPDLDFVNKNKGFLLGQQESEYCSFNANITSTEKSKVYHSAIRNPESSEPNNIEQVTKNKETESLELAVQQVNSPKKSDYISVAPNYQGSNPVIENSETPDFEFLHHEQELTKRIPSYIGSGIPKDIDEVYANNKNADEEKSSSNIRLSTETVNFDNYACDKQREPLKDKINILSNIRIAPLLHNKTNQSYIDFQVLNEKYRATLDDFHKTKNELTRVKDALAHKKQGMEAFEVTHNLELNQSWGKKSVPRSLPNNNFLLNTFIEKKSLQNQAKLNEIDYLKNPAKSLPRLPAKKFLLHKFNARQEESTSSTLKARISTESYFETLGTTRCASSSQESGNEILMPKKPLYGVLAINESKNLTPLIHQKLHETGDLKGFHSFSSLTLTTCDTKEPKKRKLLPHDKMPNSTNKKITLAENVQLRESNEGIDISYLLPQGDLGERKLIKQVELVDRKQKSKENKYGRLKTIHEEFDELVKKRSSVEGKTLKQKNSPMNFDDVQMEAESDPLYNLMSKPQNEVGEAFNIDDGKTNRRNVDQRDEEYHKFMQENYSIEAMADALKTFLATRKVPPKKNKKPQKKRILKFKLGSRKKGKSIIKGRVLYEPFLEKWGFR